MSKDECCEEPEATRQPPAIKMHTGPGGCFASLAISLSVVLTMRGGW